VQYQARTRKVRKKRHRPKDCAKALRPCALTLLPLAALTRTVIAATPSCARLENLSTSITRAAACRALASCCSFVRYSGKSCEDLRYTRIEPKTSESQLETRGLWCCTLPGRAIQSKAQGAKARHKVLLHRNPGQSECCRRHRCHDHARRHGPVRCESRRRSTRRPPGGYCSRCFESSSC